MSLLLKRAEPILSGDLLRLEKALAGLAERHKDSVMIGRTLLQAAPPVTFGLKAAGWLGSVRRGRHRLQNGFRAAAVLQFGGASGTLASLGDRGMAVMEALGTELGLGTPSAPWHTQRDQVATLICACGVLTGSLGKMARDISLLMQNEVGEASEPAGEGRGGSSTMPQQAQPYRLFADADGSAPGARAGGIVSLGDGAGARTRPRRMAGGVAGSGGGGPVDRRGYRLDG